MNLASEATEKPTHTKSLYLSIAWRGKVLSPGSPWSAVAVDQHGETSFSSACLGEIRSLLLCPSKASCSWQCYPPNCKSRQKNRAHAQKVSDRTCSKQKTGSQIRKLVNQINRESQLINCHQIHCTGQKNSTDHCMFSCSLLLSTTCQTLP